MRDDWSVPKGSLRELARLISEANLNLAEAFFASATKRSVSRPIK